MDWQEIFPAEKEPSMEEITAAVTNVTWDELNAYMQQTYSVQPKIEYSCCGGAPGWNVKYKKGGRSLCTLYPAAGRFTCLVCIGRREAVEAELLLPACTEYTQKLYGSVPPLNGSRWLMMDITSEEILSDAKRLIATRVAKK